MDLFSFLSNNAVLLSILVNCVLFPTVVLLALAHLEYDNYKQKIAILYLLEQIKEKDKKN